MVGDELRTVIFTDEKAIFTAVKEEKSTVYKCNAVFSCLIPDWSVGIKEWKSSVDYLVRIVSGNSKSILFPRKLNQAPQASDTRNAAALVSETKPLAIEFRAAPVSKLRMAIPTTPSGMTTGKQIRVLVRNCPTFQTHTCMLAWC